MAITIEEQPYGFAARGQKLLFYASSTNYVQPQFKYGVLVYVGSTAQTLQFFVSPDINGYLVFDLASVVKLYNEDAQTNWHATNFTNEQSETYGKGYEYYSVTIQEWWLVAGTFTHVDASDQLTEHIVFNGVLQPSYGYKPDTNTGTIPYGFKLEDVTSRAMSDRFHDTHNWFYAVTSAAAIPEARRTFIPCLSTDYGLLTVPTSNFITGNDIGRVQYTLFHSGAPYVYTKFFGTPEITHFGAYPMNINNDPAIALTPANTPTWTYYQLVFQTSSGSARSMRYIFYNAEKFGQSDCRHDNVRLGWVNSRGGWDYFNFIKKNEWTNNAERKQYRQVLYRPAPTTFLSTDRQLTDRETILRRTLQIQSDWVQENEFVFLRNLFASNQVQIIQEDGTQVPVSIADSSFAEKKTRDGKLYNVTMNVTPSQDYWT